MKKGYHQRLLFNITDLAKYINPMKLNDELTNSIASVTEAAAIAAMPWVGKQDKNAADAAAVAAMRERLNSLNINGQIVIGEGEIDEAPMLYIGEPVGNGKVKK